MQARWRHQPVGPERGRPHLVGRAAGMHGEVDDELQRPGPGESTSGAVDLDGAEYGHLDLDPGPVDGRRVRAGIRGIASGAADASRGGSRTPVGGSPPMRATELGRPGTNPVTRTRGTRRGHLAGGADRCRRLAVVPGPDGACAYQRGLEDRVDLVRDRRASTLCASTTVPKTSVEAPVGRRLGPQDAPRLPGDRTDRPAMATAPMPQRPSPASSRMASTSSSGTVGAQTMTTGAHSPTTPRRRAHIGGGHLPLGEPHRGREPPPGEIGDQRTRLRHHRHPVAVRHGAAETDQYQVEGGRPPRGRQLEGHGPSQAFGGQGSPSMTTDPRPFDGHHDQHTVAAPDAHERRRGEPRPLGRPGRRSCPHRLPVDRQRLGRPVSRVNSGGGASSSSSSSNIRRTRSPSSLTPTSRPARGPSASAPPGAGPRPRHRPGRRRRPPTRSRCSNGRRVASGIRIWPPTARWRCWTRRRRSTRSATPTPTIPAPRGTTGTPRGRRPGTVGSDGSSAPRPGPRPSTVGRSPVPGGAFATGAAADRSSAAGPATWAGRTGGRRRTRRVRASAVGPGSIGVRRSGRSRSIQPGRIQWEWSRDPPSDCGIAVVEFGDLPPAPGGAEVGPRPPTRGSRARRRCGRGATVLRPASERAMRRLGVARHRPVGEPVSTRRPSRTVIDPVLGTERPTRWSSRYSTIAGPRPLRLDRRARPGAPPAPTVGAPADAREHPRRRPSPRGRPPRTGPTGSPEGGRATVPSARPTPRGGHRP